jgi:hypothetical protein
MFSIQGLKGHSVSVGNGLDDLDTCSKYITNHMRKLLLPCAVVYRRGHVETLLTETPSLFGLSVRVVV